MGKEPRIEDLERALALRRREIRLKRWIQEGRLPVESSAPPPLAASESPSLPPDPVYHSEVEWEEHSPRFRIRLPRPSWSAWRDRLLLAIEIAAVVGAMALLLFSWQTMRGMQLEAVAARITPSPTPLIQAVVLPGGHRPPTAPGGPAPNPEEVPEHLRALVAALPTPVPITPGPRSPTRIVIPSIGVDAPIVPGTDWEALKKGVGHHPGTANPGERGNMVLAAHNDIYGEIFRDLEKLRPGDEIWVYAGSHAYRYVVVQRQIVLPTQVEVMAPTRDPVVTLITCYPYLVDTHRLVVVGELR
ncbi:sortase [Thermoflexus sp.]|uniref:sortase n=1 Tax=Thermoflexus sp. TaxID=1969742 RepID=UPI0035E44837